MHFCLISNHLLLKKYPKSFLQLDSTSSLIESRIVGGKRVQPGVHKYSFVVYIEIPINDEKNKLEVSCGGSLISTFHVLTAAHCVYKANEDESVFSEMTVKVRSMNNKNGTECSVLEVDMYDDFDIDKMFDSKDIAVLTVNIKRRDLFI